MTDQLSQGPHAARSTLGGSPFPPIADYGFLSDCEVSALVAPSGNVEWMCLPHDVWGVLLDSVYLHTRSRDRLDERRWPMLVRQVEAALAHWRDSDQGLWEVRGPAQILGRPAGIKTVIAFDAP
jgi:hypothetical protein